MYMYIIYLSRPCCVSFQDHIDIVRDQMSASDYKKEEDPKLFVSKKTKRGPLRENWIADYSEGSAT